MPFNAFILGFIWRKQFNPISYRVITRIEASSIFLSTETSNRLSISGATLYIEGLSFALKETDDNISLLCTYDKQPTTTIVIWMKSSLDDASSRFRRLDMSGEQIDVSQSEENTVRYQHRFVYFFLCHIIRDLIRQLLVLLIVIHYHLIVLNGSV